MTPQQARFVQEYLVDLNGARAAIRAGYSPDTAQPQSSRLLSNVKVWEAVQEGRKALGEKLGATAERVLAELVRLAFADIRDIADWDGEKFVYRPSAELGNDAAASIAEIQDKTTTTVSPLGAETTKREVRIKQYDRLKALDMLGRYLGIFKADDSSSNAATLAAILGRVPVDQMVAYLGAKKPA